MMYSEFCSVRPDLNNSLAKAQRAQMAQRKTKLFYGNTLPFFKNIAYTHPT